jgi:hypothetical protein
MNEQTGHAFRKVVIEEFYVKERDVVFRIWRFEGGEWQRQETPLREFPTVELRYPDQFNKPDWRDIEYGKDT